MSHPSVLLPTITRADLLIVDDTPANLRLLSDTLSEQGYKVRCVTNGKTALRAVQNQPPDLILLDVKMPGMDGYEVCRQLKDDVATQNIPVIFLSALNEVLDKVTAFGVGASDYITKPFQFEEVLARVKHHLELKRVQTEFLHLNAELEERVIQRTAALRESETRFREMANHAPVLLWMTDEQGACTFCNDRWLNFTGRSLEQEVGAGWITGMHPDDRQVCLRTYYDAVLRRVPYTIEYRLRRAEGDYRWVLATGTPRYLPDGQMIGYIGSGVDINERKELEIVLTDREQQFRLVFELAPVGMALMALDGHFIRVNPALCKILGYTNAELLELTWMQVTYSADLEKNLQRLRQLIQDEVTTLHFEKRYLHKNGEPVHTVVGISLSRDTRGEPDYLITQVVDITDRKRVEDQLIHDALHDALTGLPNRAFLIQQINQLLSRQEHYPSHRFAVIMIDVDRFKRINDSLGHTTGDQLLIAIANLLIRRIRPIDTVARLGGDEFALLIDGLDEMAEVIQLTEAIQQDLQLPFSLVGHDVVASASIGIVFSAPEYRHGGELLRDADIAMYRAKANGRSRYELFDKGMHAEALKLLKLEADLQRALDRQEFIAYYQPVVALATGRLMGFEALIRWQHPERGLVPPNDFIPIAEDNGLIVPIGTWVLRESCQQLQRWQDLCPQAQNLQMSVNLSSRQFRETAFLEQIDEVLAATHLPGHCLKLELTERILMDDTKSTINLLHQLKKRQIQLSIDDFGTGFSSLNYLHQFPIDTLKIDKSFVQQIGDTASKSGIVEAIVQLAEALGLDVIAEGIETQAQVHYLQGLHCGHGQGYFFSRPLSPPDATALLLQHPDGLMVVSQVGS